MRGVAPWSIAVFLSAALAPGGADAAGGEPLAAADDPALSAVLEQLPLMGHRNWIVVADSAYPWQSRAGIETLMARSDQLALVEAVLEALDAAAHVRPMVYLDAELEQVPEDDAPGVSAYRTRLDAILGDRPIEIRPHEEIIAALDEAGEAFRVLIVKTDLTIPYTSVFLELDCGYWSGQAEARLRAAMGAAP